MHRVTKIVTNDGKMFDTKTDAKRYLDKKYTTLVFNFASRLLNITKYQEMKEFLDENIETLEEMLALKRELDEEEL